MSVINVETELLLGEKGATCSLCGGRLLYPYLHYCSDNALNICGSCCVSQGRGLRADILQIEAIMKLQENYPDYTLVRMHRRDAEEYNKRRFGIVERKA